MSILTQIRPNVQNRTLFHTEDRACDALRRELVALNYGPAIIREILPFAHDLGSLAEPIALGMIDAEDIDRLTEAFISGFDPVHPSSPQWSDASTWWPTIPTADEARQFAELDGRFDVLDAPLDPPPDLGDDRDWAEWAAWSDGLESRNPWPDYESAELAEIGVGRR